MSRELCKHGVLLERPCIDCHMDLPSGQAITAKDRLISELEAEVSLLRSQLANSQQVSQLAMELMHVGEFTI